MIPLPKTLSHVPLWPILAPIPGGGGGGLVTKLHPIPEIPWTIARQAPLSMGLSRQEYWSGLPFPSAGDIPGLRIELRSPALHTPNLFSIPIIFPEYPISLFSLDSFS